MKVLVTGAGGMLGQDLCPTFKEKGYEVIETDIHNLDITDINAVNEKIEKEKPDFVIHLAAYTNVDRAEVDFECAKLINAKGTENLALACDKNDVTMVYISTDYVFEGNGEKPYLPTDKTSPINNYGLTKLMGEQAVQKYCKKFYITRTSWLYGLWGKNFVETMISLADKPELKVVDDQVGCPTWTMELVNGILKLIEENANYGIYHVCGSGNTSWHNFAKTIFELTKIKANLIPCTTDEFPRPAKRPKYSVMENNGICRHWVDALAEYIKLRSSK